MMLPLTLMQLLLAYLSMDGDRPVSYEYIIQTWQKDMDEYRNYRFEHKQKTLEAGDVSNSISEKKRLIDMHNRNISACETEINSLKRTMKDELKNNNRLHTVQNQNFHSCYSEIEKLRSEINVLARKEIASEGVWSKVKAGLVNAGNLIIRQEKERQMDKLYHRLVEILIENNLHLCDSFKNEIYTKKDEVEEIKKFLDKETDELNQSLSSLREVMSKRLQVEKNMSTFEKKYYGLPTLDFHTPALERERANEFF
ncbi:hypothetical protein ACERII_23820 [Evansella sp. AB-rgal1]|uniref:hypothetical protein n=1 Tax=Evansella sp. AB-rgal1 TaxID=3242696 RepID=UPI00359D9FB8